MPPKKKKGDKPSVAKSRKGRASTASGPAAKAAKTTKKSIKKPKKVVAKKRAPKKGARTVATGKVRSSVSAKRRPARLRPAKETKPITAVKPVAEARAVASRGPQKKITIKIVERRPWGNALNPVRPAKSDYVRAAAFVALLVGLLVSGYSMKAIAATWQGPTFEAPGGNIPVTIWNRNSSGTKQAFADIDIDGELQVGATDYEPAGDGVAHNLVYAVGHYYDYSTGTYYMESDDYFMKLETYYTNHPTLGDYYSTRFTINRGGGVWTASNMSASTGLIAGYASRSLDETTTGEYNIYSVARYDVSDPADTRSHPKGDYLLLMQTRDYDAPGDPYQDRFTVNMSGDVFATGCFGPTFVGLTAASYAPGDVSGYYGAQNKCQLDYPNDPGVHVCTSQEILESIKCSVSGDAIRAVADGTAAWVNGGPPGFTANTNDCQGWTSTASNTYGRYWIFNLASGGRGTTTSCNSPGIPFACCR